MKVVETDDAVRALKLCLHTHTTSKWQLGELRAVLQRLLSPVGCRGYVAIEGGIWMVEGRHWGWGEGLGVSGPGHTPCSLSTSCPEDDKGSAGFRLLLPFLPGLAFSLSP